MLIQLEAKCGSATAAQLSRALHALVLLGGKPSHMLANTLVIKTQQQLAATAVTPAAAVGRSVQDSTSELLFAGVPAVDFAGALWACSTVATAAAAGGVKLPPVWVSAAVKQLSAAADQLPAAALYYATFAAVAGGLKPPPRGLLQALRELDQQQQQAVELLAQLDQDRSGCRGVVKQLRPYLHQQQQQQQGNAHVAAPVDAAASASAAAAQLLKLVSQTAKAAEAKAAEGAAQTASTVLSASLEDIRQLTAVVITAMQVSGGGSQVLSEVLEPAKWAALLRALAMTDTQQEGGSGLLGVEGMRGLVQAVSACVQANASSTATAADGPATLVALLQLELPVEPDWLRHLTASMDTAAAAAAGVKGVGSKANWCRQAGAADVLAYLHALALLQQAPSPLQCDALCHSLAVQSRLQQLQPQQLALLLVLLAEGCSAATAGSSSSSSSDSNGPGHSSGGKSPADCVIGVQAVFAAGLPAVLSAVHQGEELPFKVAQGLINATAWLDCDLQKLGFSSSSNSSSRSTKQQAAAASGLELGCIALVTAAVAATAELSAVGAAATRGDSQISHGDVTSTLWLLNQVHSCSPVPQAVQHQALAAAHAYLSLQELPLPPGDAARLFYQIGALALSLNPGLAEYDTIPDPDLGGVLVQLQQDMEADWGHASMTSAELVQLPQLMSKFKLEVQRPEQYAAAVYGQLQGMDAAPQAAVTAASRKGRGPVELLYVLCWLLMEDRPGRAGDTTLQGLDEVTAAAQGTDSSSSSTDSSSSSTDSSSSSTGDVQPASADVDITPAAAQQLCELIALAKGVTLPIMSTLSGPQVLDLAHVLLMANAASSAEVALIWGMLVDRLSKPQELARLTPAQHLALLALLALGAEGGLADNVEARQAAIKSVEVLLKVRARDVHAAVSLTS
jgi:hypothetical protein